MITRDLWKITHPDHPTAASWGTRAQCEEWAGDNPRYVIEREPCCGCCGRDFDCVRAPHNGSIMVWPSGEVRCDRHHDRNPCIVEGCKRTTSAVGKDEVLRLASDQTICGTHWRRYCPPGSRMRRAYNAHWRRGKRLGWSPKRVRAFERLWSMMVVVIRRRSAEGFLDEAGINKLMGWE